MSTDIYSAIGNKVRAKLLLCLSQKAKSVSELIENCGLAQSAVSQHLAKLKKAKLVEARRSGKVIYYALSHKKIASVSQMLISLENDLFVQTKS